MFKCGDCGKTFSEPKIEHRHMGEYCGISAYKNVSVCPYCESEFIDIVLDLKNNSEKVLTN